MGNFEVHGVTLFRTMKIDENKQLWLGGPILAFPLHEVPGATEESVLFATVAGTPGEPVELRARLDAPGVPSRWLSIRAQMSPLGLGLLCHPLPHFPCMAHGQVVVQLFDGDRALDSTMVPTIDARPS